jgi:hypothetical protein
MKKIKCVCNVIIDQYTGGGKMEIFSPISDFYESDRLFICSVCDSIFAINPEAEYYSGIAFDQKKSALFCRKCQAELSGVLPYPDYIWNPVMCKIERYAYSPDAPNSGARKTVAEFWNPYEE